ncbi:MAG: isochorismatase family cysteine hydrolase [Candidatus Bathyarchaeia archaeon]
MVEAVLVIDMARDFVTGRLKAERSSRIIPKLKMLLEAARRSGRPVIYVNDAHLPLDSELSIWGEHSMAGSEEAKVIDELKPQNKDYILGKRTYSAFYETGLDPLLRQLGVDTVVLTGLHTNICVRHTAADALFRGYKIIVPEDCVDASTEREHVEGLEYLKRIYGAELVSSRELAGRWLRDY